jgi:hypothetical protein
MVIAMFTKVAHWKYILLSQINAIMSPKRIPNVLGGSKRNELTCIWEVTGSHPGDAK